MQYLDNGVRRVASSNPDRTAQCDPITKQQREQWKPLDLISMEPDRLTDS